GADAPDATQPSAASMPASPSNQPATSMMTSVVPAKLNTETRPSAPTPDVTMLGTVPTMALTFDAVGWGEPDGRTGRYVGAVGLTIVTFKATAPTGPAGTPARPATAT